MTISSAVYALVTSAQSFSGGFYPQSVDVGAKPPFGRYTLSTVPSLAHDGDSNFYTASVQVDIWDDSYDGAEAIANTIKAACHGYTGTIGGVTVSPARVTNVIPAVESANDLFGFIIEMEIIYAE